MKIGKQITEASRKPECVLLTNSPSRNKLPVDQPSSQANTDTPNNSRLKRLASLLSLRIRANEPTLLDYLEINKRAII